MTAIEYDIINELYFITTFSDLVKAVDLTEEQLENKVRELLQNGWLHQYVYQKEKKDFVKQSRPLLSEIQYHAYVATKTALLNHNGIDV